MCLILSRSLRIFVNTVYCIFKGIKLVISQLKFIYFNLLKISIHIKVIANLLADQFMLSKRNTAQESAYQNYRKILTNLAGFFLQVKKNMCFFPLIPY